MPPIGGWKTGVYAIRNLVNNKVYVGSAAKSFEQRFKGHRVSLKAGRHGNKHLQRAWNFYGETGFEFLILERCMPALCIEREQFWIDLWKASNLRFGYNKSPTAGSCLGLKRGKLSQEAIIKRTLKQRGLKRTELTKQRLRVSLAKPSTKAKKSAQANRVWAERPLDERNRIKAAISKALMGRKASKQTRMKLSEAQQKRFQDPLERKKLADAKIGNQNNKGTRWSAEAKQRQSDRIREAWRKRREQSHA